MFISGYTPSRLQIWRNYSNSGFPVSQQPALRYLTNQGAASNFPLFASINSQIYSLTNGNTANPIAISNNNGLSFPLTPNLPLAQVWRGIAGSPTRIIMTGGANTTDIAYSDNGGVTWNPATVLSPANWSQCAYGNGIFLIAGPTAVVSRSTDNAGSFTLEAAAIAAGGMKFLNGFFYHFSGASCYRSATGLAGSWTLCRYDGANNFGANNQLAFIYAAGLWVCAFGNLVLMSSDGLNFTSVRLPIIYTPTAIAYANNNFIFTSNNVSNVVMTSADLIWFTQRQNMDSIAMPDGLTAPNGVALLRDSAFLLRTPDTGAYEVSYV